MEAVSSKESVKKGALFLFLPLLLLYATSYFQRTAVPGTIFDQLAVAIGRGFVAALGPAFIWTYSASQLAIGVLIDRFSVKYVVLTGGAFFVLGVLLFPFMNDPWGMYAVRMCAGLGAGSLYLSLVRECSRLFGRHNYALLMGVVFVVGYGGGMLGTLPFGRVVRWCGNDWRLVLTAMGIFSLVCYLWFIWSYRKENAAEMVSKGDGGAMPLLQSLKKLFFSWRNWRIMLGGTVNFAIYFTIQTVFGKKFLMEVPRFSEAGAEIVILVMTLVCMSVLFSSSLLSKLLKNRRKPLIYFAAFLELLTVITMVLSLRLSWNIWIYPVCFCCFAAASGMLIAYIMLAQEMGCEGMMTQSAALYNMINYFGAMAFTMIASAYLESFATSGSGTAYPPEAYTGLFEYLLIPGALGIAFVVSLPETGGKFLNSL